MSFDPRRPVHQSILFALSTAIGLALLGVMLAADVRGSEQPKESHEKEIVTYGPWTGYWQQARLSAYSPNDAIDRTYRETKGERWRWITADGRTDVRSSPHGIAAPSSLPFRTRVFIPRGLSYLDETSPDPHSRCFAVDDRGSAIERGSLPEGRLWLDLRYRTEYSALAFGVKDAWVFIITGGM